MLLDVFHLVGRCGRADELKTKTKLLSSQRTIKALVSPALYLEYINL
jgi:hypothetical protein